MDPEPSLKTPVFSAFAPNIQTSENETVFRGLLVQEKNEEFLERMEHDLTQDEDILHQYLENSAKWYSSTTETAKQFIRFVREDWEEYVGSFSRKYQRLLIVQLSILTIVVYSRLHLLKDDNTTVISEILTYLLFFMSILIIPYAIYVSVDFLFFIIFTYIANGIIVRFPEYLTQLEINIEDSLREDRFGKDIHSLFQEDVRNSYDQPGVELLIVPDKEISNNEKCSMEDDNTLICDE